MGRPLTLSDGEKARCVSCDRQKSRTDPRRMGDAGMIDRRHSLLFEEAFAQFVRSCAMSKYRLLWQAMSRGNLQVSPSLRLRVNTFTEWGRKVTSKVCPTTATADVSICTASGSFSVFFDI